MAHVAFNLLHLPAKTLRNVFQLMSHSELFIFSFASICAKRLVKSMNFEMLELDLVYSRPCKLKISFGEHEEFIIEFDEFGTLSKQEPSDAFVFLIAYKLDIRDCINHVLEVYKISKLHTLKVIGAINNPQNLLKIIGKLDLKVLWIFFNFSENSTTISVYREILNHLGARCDVRSLRRGFYDKEPQKSFFLLRLSLSYALSQEPHSRPTATLAARRLKRRQDTQPLDATTSVLMLRSCRTVGRGTSLPTHPPFSFVIAPHYYSCTCSDIQGEPDKLQ
eukprot:NP_493457.1 F-box B protein [Caenorhabditis elegans]